MIRFGTGGWRAVIADGFTRENIRLVAAGLCRLMEQEGLAGKEIVVGYDRRFLSKESAHWAAEVLAGFGFRVFMVSRSSPTPLIMHTVKQRGTPYGMAITASHNPAIYNGIKVFTEGGRDAEASVTKKIEEQISRITPADVKSMDYDQAVALGIVREEYPFNDYIDSILQMVDVERIKNAGLRVAIDPMYGVSQSSLRTILLTCRCDVDVLHEQHDTLFGGRMPAPSADALKLLSNYVVENRCSLGIATDGDADRLGVIDEFGNYLHANTLLVLMYYYFLKYRNWQGPCVRNNSTTHLLDRVALDFGQECHEVPVGFKYISAKMAETDAIIGGESSGGMAVKGHIQGKDGIYAAALIVEMLAVTGKSVAQLYEEILQRYGQLHYEEIAVSMTDSKKKLLQEKIFVEKQLPDFREPVEKVDRSDGCKVYFADGSWVICRFSGTEPVLRMAAEGNTPAQAKDYIRRWQEDLGL
ncbi:MAG: phosphoglucomutase/phosphomannomutase family protein [Oscillospiraceae bacterium]|nr:phosphoglucomutase/phosphomannomutase family protein [Oscillospiraceae bacterium]